MRPHHLRRANALAVCLPILLPLGACSRPTNPAPTVTPAPPSIRPVPPGTGTPGSGTPQTSTSPTPVTSPAASGAADRAAVLAAIGDPFAADHPLPPRYLAEQAAYTVAMAEETYFADHNTYTGLPHLDVPELPAGTSVRLASWGADGYCLQATATGNRLVQFLNSATSDITAHDCTGLFPNPGGVALTAPPVNAEAATVPMQVNALDDAEFTALALGERALRTATIGLSVPGSSPAPLADALDEVTADSHGVHTSVVGDGTCIAVTATWANGQVFYARRPDLAAVLTGTPTSLFQGLRIGTSHDAATCGHVLVALTPALRAALGVLDAQAAAQETTGPGVSNRVTSRPVQDPSAVFPHP